MANGQHGGYRRPSNPAAVSGPGALSARTDGGAGQPVRVAPGGEYGSRKDMEQIQSGARMQGGGGQLPPPPPVTPLDAPSEMPDVPVTDGADAGPGLDSRAAGIRGEKEISDEQLRPLLYSLELMANLPGSNQETRQFVRALKARLAE